MTSTRASAVQKKDLPVEEEDPDAPLVAEAGAAPVAAAAPAASPAAAAPATLADKVTRIKLELLDSTRRSRSPRR